MISQVALLIAWSSAFAAEPVPGAGAAHEAVRPAFTALRASLAASRQEQARARAAGAERPRFAEQMACYRGMGATTETVAGQKRARVPGRFSGRRVTFIFTLRSASYQTSDGAVHALPAGSVATLNAALVSQARARLAIDPGGFEMSACARLQGPMPIHD